MLKLVNVKKYYKMGDSIVKALDDVSFEVNRGEFVAIVGPSGSGKSTLMNILGCLDIPTEGKYFVDGLDVSKFKESELAKFRNKRIGFIFQGFNLLPKLSAFENVELPMIYQGLKKKERVQRAVDALSKVGISQRSKHLPTELSGGQQQRVAIARAIATQPDVILADEPTGNLDSKTGEEVLEILKNLNQSGTTIVMITHDNNIAAHAKRIVKILDGKIFEGENFKG